MTGSTHRGGDSTVHDPLDFRRICRCRRMHLPDLSLAATDGGSINLARLSGRTVVYVYPRTGRPGVALPKGWDAIPGARGCTPQSCGFRDHFRELQALGVHRVYGLSSQDREYQREVGERLHLPFALLSDHRLELQRALQLPSFEIDGMTLLKHMVLVVDDGVIIHVFYPVFPPDRGAEEVIAWLQARASS
jgi:peroxiredoxin